MQLFTKTPRRRRRKRTRELRAAMDGGSEELTIVRSLLIQASSDEAVNDDDTDSDTPHPATYSGAAYNGDDIWQPGYSVPLVVNCATAVVAKDPQVMLKDHDPARPIGHHRPVIPCVPCQKTHGGARIFDDAEAAVWALGLADFVARLLLQHRNQSRSNSIERHEHRLKLSLRRGFKRSRQIPGEVIQ